jgi:hypothetical protein
VQLVRIFLVSLHSDEIDYASIYSNPLKESSESAVPEMVFGDSKFQLTGKLGMNATLRGHGLT